MTVTKAQQIEKAMDNVSKAKEALRAAYIIYYKLVPQANHNNIK